MRLWLMTAFGCLSFTLAGQPGWSDEWPQFLGPQRDGVWRETGIVAQLPAELRVQWQTPVALGYAGPAVAHERVFLTDYIAPGESDSSTTDAAAQDTRNRGRERIMCFDAKTGAKLWQHEYACLYEIGYPSGPRATPTIDGSQVYTLGAMGDLYCLDIRDGHVIWSKNYVHDYATRMNAWGMAAAPLIDGQKLILVVGGHPNAAVMALDKKTGQELWRSLEINDPGYCAPSIIDVGQTRQLVIWLTDALYALHPEDGRLLWRQDFAAEQGMSIATPVFDPQRQLLFASSFFNGPIMLRLSTTESKASVLWRRDQGTERKPDGLHCLMSTPHLVDGFVYGICSYGHLRCVNAQTGEQQWQTLQATGEGRWWNAFLTRHADRYFITNEQGDLIMAKLSPQGYQELGRAFLIEPTNQVQRRDIVWSPPAFADRSIFVRNDKRLIRVDLSATAN